MNALNSNTIFVDIFVEDRYYATMKYKYCPLFPLEVSEIEEQALKIIQV